MAPCSFFGLQIVLRVPEGSGFHAGVRSIILGRQGTEQSLPEKRMQYTRLSSLFAESLQFAELGYWDFIGEAGRAETEYETWCSEIEATTAEPQERTGESPYCIVSVAMLAAIGSNSDQTLRERCDIAEERFWTRDTFQQLVLTLRMVNFASIAADSIYMVPGEAGAGPSAEELRGEGYEYLPRLV